MASRSTTATRKLPTASRPVRELGQRIANAHGLLLVTPEYNNSIPGPFKNAIDWLSRIEDMEPPDFTGKPVAVIGASPGGFGTLLSQNAWLPVLRTLETRPWFGGRLMVARAAEMFNADGQLTDEKSKKRLREFIAGLPPSSNLHHESFGDLCAPWQASGALEFAPKASHSSNRGPGP